MMEQEPAEQLTDGLANTEQEPVDEGRAWINELPEDG